MSRMQKMLLVFVVAALVGTGGWFIGERTRTDMQTALQPVIPAPDLTKAVAVTAALTEESKAKALARISELRAELAAQSDLYTRWMDLALQMKLVGEYAEAETIWLYAAARWPGESTPHGNLANLYVYELQDFGKAETEYLKAIEVQPKLANAYYSAYEFYRFIRKDTAKAREILERGIAADLENRSVLEPFLAEL